MSEEIRNPMKMSTRLFVDAVKQDHEAGQRYCFILGSGASLTSNIRTGEKLMVEWRKYLLNKGLSYIKNCANITGYAWETCKHIFEDSYKLKNEDYYTLYDLRFAGTTSSGYYYLEKEMEDKKPSVGYYYLSSILQNTDNKLVITTNFDSLTEDAIFNSYGTHPLVISNENLAPYVQNVTSKPTVAKINGNLLHGSRNRSENLDYLRREWEENLRVVFSRYIPIVIGYAGGDKTLMQLLGNMKLKKIFWCELEGRNISNAAKDIVCDNNGYHVTIEGFDELLYQLSLELGGHPDPIAIKAWYDNLSDDYSEKHDKLVEKYKNISHIVAVDEPLTVEAVETARTVSKETNKSESKQDVAFFDALTKYAEDKYEEAIAILNKLIIVDSNNPDYYINRGKSLYELDRYEEAIADYSKAIELNPNYAAAYNNRGYVLDDLDQYEEAIADYSKAIDLDPNYATAYNNRGAAMRNLDRHEEALADYSKAIELSPDDAVVLCNRGVVLDDLGRHKEALLDYNKAVELDPGDAEVFYNRGVVLNTLKLYDEALLDYNKAIEIDPSDADYFSGRATTLRALGLDEEAEADEAKAKELSKN